MEGTTSDDKAVLTGDMEAGGNMEGVTNDDKAVLTGHMEAAGDMFVDDSDKVAFVMDSLANDSCA
jgi:hypothetical protein